MNGAARPAGRMIAVVGPSGVGKDSVMAGLLEARPALRRVRRVITRAPVLSKSACVENGCMWCAASNA